MSQVFVGKWWTVRRPIQAAVQKIMFSLYTGRQLFLHAKRTIGVCSETLTKSSMTEFTSFLLSRGVSEHTAFRYICRRIYALCNSSIRLARMLAAKRGMTHGCINQNGSKEAFNNVYWKALSKLEVRRYVSLRILYDYLSAIQEPLRWMQQPRDWSMVGDASLPRAQSTLNFVSVSFSRWHEAAAWKNILQVSRHRRNKPVIELDCEIATDFWVFLGQSTFACIYLTYAACLSEVNFKCQRLSCQCPLFV